MTLMSKGQRKWEIFQIFVAFSENLNRFKSNQQEKFVGFSCIESKFWKGIHSGYVSNSV